MSLPRFNMGLIEIYEFLLAGELFLRAQGLAYKNGDNDFVVSLKATCRKTRKRLSRYITPLSDSEYIETYGHANDD